MAIPFTPLTFSNNMPSGYALDENFADIKSALQSALSREHSNDNEMKVDLDMNARRILNLPEPRDTSEAARLADVQAALSDNSANLISFTPYDFITEDDVQSAIEQTVDKSNERYSELSNELDERVIYVGSVAELSLNGFDGAQYSLGQFWPDTAMGGGIYEWVASRSKADHTGGTVIDPDKISELVAPGSFGTYFTPATTGMGVYVRLNTVVVTPDMFGALLDDSVDDTEPFWAAYAINTLPITWAGTAKITVGFKRKAAKRLEGSGMDSAFIHFVPATSTEALFIRPDGSISGSVIAECTIYTDAQDSFASRFAPTEAELIAMNDNICFDDYGLRYGCELKNVRILGFGIPRQVEDTYYASTSGLHVRYYKDQPFTGTGGASVVNSINDWGSSYGQCLKYGTFTGGSLRGINFWGPACENAKQKGWVYNSGRDILISKPYYEGTPVALEINGNVGSIRHLNANYGSIPAGGVGVLVKGVAKVVDEGANCDLTNAEMTTTGFQFLLIDENIAVRVSYGPGLTASGSRAPMGFNTTNVTPNAVLTNNSKIEYLGAVLQIGSAEFEVKADSGTAATVCNGMNQPFPTVSDALYALVLMNGSISEHEGFSNQYLTVNVLTNNYSSVESLTLRSYNHPLKITFPSASPGAIRRVIFSDCKKVRLENCSVDDANYPLDIYNGVFEASGVDVLNGIAAIRASNAAVTTTGGTNSATARSFLSFRSVLSSGYTGTDTTDASSFVV